MGSIAEARAGHGSHHIRAFAAMRRMDRCAHEDASPRSLPMQVEISPCIAIKSHGPIELVGHNPRAASGFTDVYSVWLKCQVREPVSVLSLDIGTGFQIFQRRFTEIQAHLEGCAPIRRGVSRTAAMKKATMGMNFSAMELSILIHDSKQQLRPIRRGNQSGLRTNDHSQHLKSELSGRSNNKWRFRQSCY
jgi:hypothetical protein